MSIETLEHDMAQGIAEYFGLSDTKRQWIYGFIKHQLEHHEKEKISDQPVDCGMVGMVGMVNELLEAIKRERLHPVDRAAVGRFKYGDPVFDAIKKLKCAIAAMSKRESGIPVRAIEIDFENELPRITFEVPKDSAWGLGKYRINAEIEGEKS